MKKSLCTFLILFSVSVKTYGYKISHLEYYGSKAIEYTSEIIKHMGNHELMSVLFSLPVINMNFRHHLEMNHFISDRFSMYFIQIGGAVAYNAMLQLMLYAYYLAEDKIHGYYDENEIHLPVKNDKSIIIGLNHETINMLFAEGDLPSHCHQSLKNVIVSPFQKRDRLRTSFIDLRAYNPEKIRYINNSYSDKNNHWFEQACTSKKKSDLTEPVSAINKNILSDICFELTPDTKKDFARRYYNLKGQHASTDNYMAVKVSIKNDLSVYNVCDIEKGQLVLVQSERSDAAIFLQEYLLNMILKDNRRESYELSVTELFESFYMSLISTIFFDYLSFKLFSGSCPYCGNNVKFPGFPACEKHWYCSDCLASIRKVVNTRCPACGLHKRWPSLKKLARQKLKR